MSSRSLHILARMWTFLVIAALVPVRGWGCWRWSNVGEISPTNANLRAVRDAYFEATKSLGHPPASKAELIPSLKKFGDPAQLLRSADDGEEFVIVYGIDPMANDNLPCVWTYERRGKDGKRWFLRNRNIQRFIDDDFRKLPLPAGHKPAY